MCKVAYIDFAGGTTLTHGEFDSIDIVARVGWKLARAGVLCHILKCSERKGTWLRKGYFIYLRSEAHVKRKRLCACKGLEDVCRGKTEIVLPMGWKLARASVLCRVLWCSEGKGKWLRKGYVIYLRSEAT